MRSLAVVVTLLLSGGTAAAGPLSGEIELRLDAALVRPDGTTEPVTINLFGLADKFAWGVTAYSPKWDLRFHTGRVTQQHIQSDGAQIELSLRVNKARSLYGGPIGLPGILDLTLDLTREGDAIRGTYTGTWSPADDKSWTKTGEAETKVSGEVTGRILGPGLDLTNVQAGHPRLLFNNDDLPTIRQCLKTPQGRRILTRLEQVLRLDRGGFRWGQDCWQQWAGSYVEGHFAVGHALMYQLTGEKRHADRARLLARLAMARNGGEWGGWAIYLKTAGVALTYDLACDAWDEPFRQECRRWLHANSDGRSDTVDLHFDAQNAAGAGLAALAILGDPYQLQPRPVAPDQAQPVEPIRNLSTNRVPVVPFAGSRPRSFLVSGPYLRGPDSQRDMLRTLGGRAAARPREGAEVIDGNRRYRWKRIDDYNFWLYKFDPGGFETTDGDAKAEAAVAADGYDPNDKSLPTWLYFYTVLEVGQPCTIRVEPNGWCSQYGPPMPLSQVRMWVAGQEVCDGDVLQLETGKYPLMIETPDKGQIVWNPVIERYDQERYEELLAEWEVDHAAWLAAGQSAPHAADHLRAMTRFIQRYTQNSLGERGFPREGSNCMDAWYTLLPFASALKHQTGYDLAATPEGEGLRWIVPLQLWTEPRFTRHDWSGFHWRTLGSANMIEPSYRPLLRWSIDRREDMGVFLPADALFLLAGGYPWDVAPKPPVEMDLPLHLADQRMGGYVFRSGWRPDEDFRLVVQLQNGAPRSSVTAGDFSLYGYPDDFRYWGMNSAGGGFFRQPCLTQQEQPCVLRITGAIPTRGGELVHLGHRDDGSGVVSLRQDYWTLGTSDSGFSWPKVLDPTDLGIRHLRSIAVDYSGRCGAPVLLVVADHVTGCTPEHQPFLQLNSQPRTALKRSGPSFAFDHEYEDADGAERNVTLTGHVIPTDAHTPSILPAESVKRWDGMLYIDRMTEAPDGASPAQPEPARQGDRGARRPKERFYLLVMTVQEGTPPDVVHRGTGVDTVVTVGKQSVKFDGEKIVLSR